MAGRTHEFTLRLAAACFAAVLCGPAAAVGTASATLSNGETTFERKLDRLPIELRFDVTDSGVEWRASFRAMHDRFAGGYGLTVTAGRQRSVGERTVSALGYHRFVGSLKGVRNGRRLKILLTRPAPEPPIELGRVRIEVPPPFSITSPTAGARVRTSSAMSLGLRGFQPDKAFLQYALEGPHACVHDDLRREEYGVTSPAWLQLGIVPGQACEAALHVLAEVRHEETFLSGSVEIFRRASVPIHIVDDVKEVGIVAGWFDDKDLVDPVRMGKIRQGLAAPSPRYAVDLSRAQFYVQATYDENTLSLAIQKRVWSAGQRQTIGNSGGLTGLVVVDGTEHSLELGFGFEDFPMPQKNRYVDIALQHKGSKRRFSLGRVALPQGPRLRIRPAANATIRQARGAKIRVRGPPAQHRWRVLFDSPDGGCVRPSTVGAASNTDIAPRDVVFQDGKQSCSGVLEVTSFSPHQVAPEVVDATEGQERLSFVRVHTAYRTLVPLRFAP